MIMQTKRPFPRLDTKETANVVYAKPTTANKVTIYKEESSP